MKKSEKKLSIPLKLYTKSGDRGESSLGDGRRLPKNHPVFRLLGDVDELNCSLGIVVAKLNLLTELPRAALIAKELLQIQHQLFDVGAVVANAPGVSFPKSNTARLERMIDWYQHHTSSDWYTRFLLPGGSELSAYLDMSRAICRRCERSLVNLERLPEPPLHPSFASVQLFMNRLSDYVYALRTWVNDVQGVEERQFVKTDKDKS